jgi:Protein of unknown function (DUF1360)
MAPELQDAPPFRGYAPDKERPLGGYAFFMVAYAALVGAFAGWFRASGRDLPDRVEPYDLALMAVATHKSARVITKDKITAAVRAPFTEYEGDASAPAEVSESARGRGLRRSMGELLICPYCLSMWISTAFAAGMLVAPRLTRQVAAVFTTLFGADALQLAYKRAAG